MKKILILKVISICILIIILVTFLVVIVSAAVGISYSYASAYSKVEEISSSSAVLNNHLYADRYKKVLNKYLIDKGYVSLERLVFYLQRTNNVLDIRTLSDDIWENAYLNNLNEELKQMVPIKTLCNSFKNDTTLPEYTITSDMDSSGVLINVLDLCVVDNVDITESNAYSESYSYLPYAFPLIDNFAVSSIVFENRNVKLNLSDQTLAKINYHSGWDFSVPIGTNFYSICSGTIRKIVNTQFNDLPYNSSGNSTGNYVEVECENGLIVNYYHIKANSTPSELKVGSFVNSTQLLGKTSTTGLSTGPHLHLGLKDKSGNLLDALDYIDFNYKK